MLGSKAICKGSSRHWGRRRGMVEVGIGRNSRDWREDFVQALLGR